MDLEQVRRLAERGFREDVVCDNNSRNSPSLLKVSGQVIFRACWG